MINLIFVADYFALQKVHMGLIYRTWGHAEKPTGDRRAGNQKLGLMMKIPSLFGAVLLEIGKSVN